MHRWFLIFLFMAMMAPIHAQNDGFRVMTFNIRYDNPGDGPHAWKHRKDFVAEVIHNNKADVVGVQEALEHQVKQLDSLLPDFTWKGSGRDDGHQKGEFNPVFYKKSRLNLLDYNTFWLSDTPEIAGSVGWDAACPRIVTWMKFKNKGDGKEWYVFNTHFDHRGEKARLHAAELLMDTLASRAAGYPVVVTGDFNALPDSEPYECLTESGSELKLLDALKAARKGAYGPKTTYISFQADFSKERRIDYIFVNSLINVRKHIVVDDNKEGIYPSDHLPVITEIFLNQDDSKIIQGSGNN